MVTLKYIKGLICISFLYWDAVNYENCQSQIVVLKQKSSKFNEGIMPKHWGHSKGREKILFKQIQGQQISNVQLSK